MPYPILTTLTYFDWHIPKRLEEAHNFQNYRENNYFWIYLYALSGLAESNKLPGNCVI